MSSQPAAPLGMAAYRAPSLFQPHRARQALRDANAGKITPLIALYLGLSTVPTARFVAPMGYDVIWIDWEHSSCNVETMTTMVHEIMFMSEGKTIPFVRVPGHDHAAVGFALDAGASVVIPQIETVAQAQHVLSASKLGTKVRGTRSAPPFRLIPGLTDICHDDTLDLHSNLNAAAAVMLQIESLEGIRNLDRILTEVQEIDAVWLGSLDARVSMNLPGNMGQGEESEWLEAVALYEETMNRHPEVARGGFAIAMFPGFEEKAKDLKLALVATSADVLCLTSLMAELQRGKELIAPLKRGQEVVVNGKGNGVVGSGVDKA